MKAEHLAAVAVIEQESFSVPWSYEVFLEIAENPISYFYVAVNDENKICGFCGMYLIDRESQILNIAVSNTHRNRGIGRALLQKMIDDSITLGAESILLEVRESNRAARNLYENFGFDFCGKRKNYYTNPTEDALVLLKMI